MILLLLLSLACPQPIQVDRVELNHYSHGDTKFTQLIFWRSMRMTKFESHAADFKLTNEVSRTRGEMNIIRFRHEGRFHQVQTPVFRETETAIDPELRDRESLPQDMRRSYFTKETQ